MSRAELGAVRAPGELEEPCLVEVGDALRVAQRAFETSGDRGLEPREMYGQPDQSATTGTAQHADELWIEDGAAGATDLQRYEIAMSRTLSGSAIACASADRVVLRITSTQATASPSSSIISVLEVDPETSAMRTSTAQTNPSFTAACTLV